VKTTKTRAGFELTYPVRSVLDPRCRIVDVVAVRVLVSATFRQFVALCTFRIVSGCVFFFVGRAVFVPVVFHVGAFVFVVMRSVSCISRRVGVIVGSGHFLLGDGSPRCLAKR
jgi:hypothetical protein